MKRKITYLLKDFDAMVKKFLIGTLSEENKINLIKNKDIIIAEIDKMCLKYDKIIEEIKKDEA